VIAADAVIEDYGLFHVNYSLCASRQSFITVRLVYSALTVTRDI
jgi:hypothetical protein